MLFMTAYRTSFVKAANHMWLNEGCLFCGTSQKTFKDLYDTMIHLHEWHGDEDEFSMFSSLMMGIFNRYLKSSYVWLCFLFFKYYSKLLNMF